MCANLIDEHPPRIRGLAHGRPLVVVLDNVRLLFGVEISEAFLRRNRVQQPLFAAVVAVDIDSISRLHSQVTETMAPLTTIGEMLNFAKLRILTIEAQKLLQPRRGAVVGIGVAVDEYPEQEISASRCAVGPRECRYGNLYSAFLEDKKLRTASLHVRAEVCGNVRIGMVTWIV